MTRILPVDMQVFVNDIIDPGIHNTPGHSNIRVLDVMVTYLVRPRTSVVALLTETASFYTKKEYAWLRTIIGSAIVELVVQTVLVS